MHRRPETWLLLSTKPVDLSRLWSAGGGSAAVKTACIIYSPSRQLTTAPASQRIATTAVELAEMIAATAADRVLCIEDAHHTDHDTHHQASPCSLLRRTIELFRPLGCHLSRRNFTWACLGVQNASLCKQSVGLPHSVSVTTICC